MVIYRNVRIILFLIIVVKTNIDIGYYLWASKNDLYLFANES